MSAFANFLKGLNARSTEPAAHRCQYMIVVALAVMDGQSIKDRAGVVVTEAEFLEFCRGVYRKARV
jgi:hypothetical protein